MSVAYKKEKLRLALQQNKTTSDFKIHYLDLLNQCVVDHMPFAKEAKDLMIRLKSMPKDQDWTNTIDEFLNKNIYPK